MFSFNKVTLVGNLTRDPEVRTFANGGKVANFGLAVNDRKKGANGQWEDDTMFIDCSAFNSEHGSKLADQISERCRKGDRLMVDGKLKLDSWDDKATGEKRSKLKVTVFSIVLMGKVESRGEGAPAKDNAEFRQATGQSAKPETTSFDDDGSVPF